MTAPLRFDVTLAPTLDTLDDIVEGRRVFGRIELVAFIGCSLWLSSSSHELETVFPGELWDDASRSSHLLAFPDNLKERDESHPADATSQPRMSFRVHELARPGGGSSGKTSALDMDMDDDLDMISGLFNAPPTRKD